MWDWRDAWILQSVVSSGRRGALRSILANADAINVGVPPREELERVVRRLQAAGLVTAEPGRVRATPHAKRLVRRCSSWRGGIRSVTPRIEAALREAVPSPDSLGDWSLREDEWCAAYEAYATPRVLWIDAAGAIDVFRGVGDAEQYVEHWALDEHDLIVDEEGTRFEARAEKRLVRLQAVGTADWGAVCDRLARAGCDVRDEGVELLDALQARFGLTR